MKTCSFFSSTFRFYCNINYIIYVAITFLTLIYVVHSTPIPTQQSNTTISNCVDNTTSTCNDTKPGTGGRYDFKDIIRKLKEHKPLLMKSAIVLCSLTGLVILFFIVKAIRMRGRRKTRKYGVLTTSEDRLEMQRLEESDEEDEDVTVFELNGKAGHTGRGGGRK